MPEVNKQPLSIVSDATLQDGLGLTAPLTGPSTCSTSRSLGAVAAKGGAATSHATSHATSAIDSLAMVSGHAILLAAEHAATHAPAHAATHASAHAATRASAPAAERVAAKPREGFRWHSLDGSGYGDARGGKLGSQATTAPGCSGGAARRLELTPQQLEVLLAHFKVDRLPSVETRERLAHELGLSALSSSHSRHASAGTRPLDAAQSRDLVIGRRLVMCVCVCLLSDGARPSVCCVSSRSFTHFLPKTSGELLCTARRCGTPQGGILTESDARPSDHRGCRRERHHHLQRV